MHRPKFVILENVANLRGHDNGHTWEVIYKRLSSSIEEGGLNYEVKEKILSPHQFGIPQHRKRIYIVCVAREQGNLDSFEFPESRRKKCDINTIIDPSDTNVIKLKPEIRHKLSVWQEFIDQTIAHNDVIPTFPIWAMEFGATYDYENLAPAYQANEQLVGRRGKLGKVIHSGSKDYILSQLPVYAQTDKTQEFPDWKKRYIRQNREFYNLEKVEETQDEYILDGEEYVLKDEAWEAKQAQKELERIAKLTCTKRVFALMLQELGITYTMLKELIATNEQAQLEWDLCVELERKNPLLDVMALQLGVTSEQLDGLFRYANGEITIEQFRALIPQTEEPVEEVVNEDN